VDASRGEALAARVETEVEGEELVRCAADRERLVAARSLALRQLRQADTELAQLRSVVRGDRDHRRDRDARQIGAEPERDGEIGKVGFRERGGKRGGQIDHAELAVEQVAHAGAGLAALADHERRVRVADETTCPGVLVDRQRAVEERSDEKRTRESPRALTDASPRRERGERERAEDRGERQGVGCSSQRERRDRGDGRERSGGGEPWSAEVASRQLDEAPAEKKHREKEHQLGRVRRNDRVGQWRDARVRSDVRDEAAEREGRGNRRDDRKQGDGEIPVAPQVARHDERDREERDGGGEQVEWRCRERSRESGAEGFEAEDRVVGSAPVNAEERDARRADRGTRKQGVAKAPSRSSSRMEERDRGECERGEERGERTAARAELLEDRGPELGGQVDEEAARVA